MSQPLFGLVIPGRPIISDFNVVDSTKAVVLIEQPYTINEITFFLLPNAPIPIGYGAILYWSLPPFSSWTMIGAVWSEKPSGIFRTGLTTNDEVRNHSMIQIGVSLEP